MMEGNKHTSAERRWTPGSYAAAGFALFILLYNLAASLISISLPTDGWVFTGDRLADPPTIEFSRPFLDNHAPLQPGDHLVKVNGRTLDQLAQAQHEFLKMDSPDWPDGTLLQYEVLRDGELLQVEVPVRKASIWEVYTGALLRGFNPSDFVMFLTGLFIFSISLIVFLLRPSNRAAHALLFIGAGFFPLAGNSSVPTFFYPDTPISIPFDNWTLAVNPSLLYLVLAFPYPKAPLLRFPRLSILLIYLPWPAAFNLAYLLNLQDWKAYQDTAMMIYPVQILLVMLVTLVALVHTFMTVHDPVGRSQLKWLMAGIFSFVFVGVGGWMVSAYLFPETMNRGNWLITTIGWLLLPVCLAVAITRYRLFDIDLIIRRTLVYSTLTAILGLLYLGAVTLLQSLFTTASGQTSPLAIVLSTLAIAALFNPLRRRIQEFIDRRFYRQKYNAEQALAAFAGLARSETDMSSLVSELNQLVSETLHPENVQLWLTEKSGRLPGPHSSEVPSES